MVVFRRFVFARLTRPARCRVIDFSDTAPTLLPRSQILQPQSECYPLGTGGAQIRFSMWPNKRWCRCPAASSSQQWRACLTIRLDQSMLQAGQRPVPNLPRQCQPAPHVSQVAGSLSGTSTKTWAGHPVELTATYNTSGRPQTLCQKK
jgi:hypothetical protein